MTLQPNEGTRPSRLAIGRRAAGEIDGEITGPHRIALDDARDRVAPFDPAALRERAREVHVPANDNRWLRWAVPLVALAAAAVLLVALGRPTVPGVDPRYIGVRGGDRLVLYTPDGTGRMAPWTGAPLGAGDVVGVVVEPGDARGVVVLSVDGAGHVTTFWPESGDRPEPLPAGGERVPLPGSVTLDGAPGPEVFVAVFDEDPSVAADAARDSFARGGAEGVRDWAEGLGAAGDAVVVERR